MENFEELNLLQIQQLQNENSFRNFHTTIESNDVFHFIDNFSRWKKYNLEEFNKHTNKITFKLVVTPGEQFLWSKVILLKFALNVQIVIDFDYSVMDKYTMEDFFYLEDCSYHSIESFTDNSWLRILPLEIGNEQLSEQFKQVVEHIRIRTNEKEK